MDNDQSHVDEDEDEDGCASTSPQKVLVDFLDEKGSTTRFRSVACGSCHTLAQTADGEVFGCGWNEYGQACGRMSPSSEPQHMSCNVSRLTRVYFDKCRRSQSMDGSPVRTVAIAAGFAHSLALDANGSAWAWGFGEDGQLGGGSERSSYEPIEVVGTSDRRRQHEGDDDGRPAFVFAAIAAYGCHSVAVATTCEDPTSLGRVIEERRRSTTARADAIVRIQACVRRAAIRSLQRKQIAKDARLRAATREAITSGRSTPVLRELSDYALIWSDGTAMKIAIEVTRRLEAHQALAASVFAAVAAIERESSLSRRIERYDAAIASVLAVPDKDVDAAAVLSEERVPWQDHFRPLAQALDARNRAREESQLHAALKITKCERGRQSRKGTRVVIDAGCRIASFAKRVVLVRSACASLQALKRRKKLEGESAGRISSFMKSSCRNLRRRAAEEKAALMIQSVARRRVASKKRKLLERKYRRRRGEEARRQQQLQQEKEQARTLKMKKLFEERKRRAILDAREAREAARNAAMYLSGLRKKEARIAAAASEAAAKVLLRTKRDRLRDRRAQASADRAHLARHKNRAETFFPRITTATKNRIVPEVDEEKGPEDDDRFLAFGDDSEAALKKVRAASIIDRRKP